MSRSVNIRSCRRLPNILFEVSGENQNVGERTFESRSFKRASSHARANRSSGVETKTMSNAQTLESRVQRGGEGEQEV